MGPPPSADLDISYAAPAACPSRAAFEDSIRRRTEHATKPPDDPSTPQRLDVRIEPAVTGVRGRLAVRDRSGGTTVRQIEAATCAEVVDGLALIVALLFDPESAENKIEPARRPISPEPAPRPPEATKPSSRIALATSFLAASGHAPSAVAGGELSVSLETPLTSQLLLITRAGVRLTVPDTVPSHEGVATFKWWAATVALCPAIAFGDQSYAQAICLTVEQGLLGATGSETRNPRSSERSWTALGPGVVLRWVVLPPLFTVVAADVVFPLRRDRFVLGTEQIQEVPAFALRGGVGLGARF